MQENDILGGMTSKGEKMTFSVKKSCINAHGEKLGRGKRSFRLEGKKGII